MKTLFQKSNHLLHNLVPAKVVQSHIHKRVFSQFAEKMGMVYFGYVDQRDDDHKLVRGFTVSAQHRDNHFIVGSYQGYDIAIVERRDTISFPGRPTKNHTWIILTVDLHTSHDTPHIFAGLHTHGDTFYANLFTKFTHLSPLPLGGLAGASRQFVERYIVYSSPAHQVLAEQLLIPDVTKLIAEHFGSQTFEIIDGTVYIYAEHQRPSQHLLEKMLQNGVWLARYLDTAL
jgi:hypothetical protein